MAKKIRRESGALRGTCDKCGMEDNSTILGKPHRRCGGGMKEGMIEIAGEALVAKVPLPLRPKGDLLPAAERGSWGS